MNIFNYVKKYNYSFQEKEFNEVDNVILSVLSYINFKDIVSKNKRNKITLKKASINYFKLYKKSYRYDISSVKVAIKLLKLLQNSIRFKDILLYNYECIKNEFQQFQVLTFELNKNLIYISFEGTESSISGWEEDAKMLYSFPVLSQKLAIKYLNKRYTFSNKKIIVGGHSKGGNLALVSAMFSNFLVKRRIIKIYSNDGPGVLKNILESKKFEKIKERYIHIIPHTSLIGLVINQKNRVIIDSKNLIGFSHTCSNWKIEDDKFKRKKLSKASEKIEKILLNWLEKYNYYERKLFVEEIFGILKKNNITDLLQIKKDIFSFLKILKNSKELSNKSKNMINDLMGITKIENK